MKDLSQGFSHSDVHGSGFNGDAMADRGHAATVGGPKPKSPPNPGQGTMQGKINAQRAAQPDPEPSEESKRNATSAKSYEIQREQQVGQDTGGYSGISDSTANARLADLHPNAAPPENMAKPGSGIRR